MDDINTVRQRKADMLRAQFQHQQQEAETQQQIAQIETAVKQMLAPDALQRFGNIKAAHPELAMRVIAVIAQALQQGHKSVITDEQMRSILEQLTKTREIKIKRL